MGQRPREAAGSRFRGVGLAFVAGLAVIALSACASAGAGPGAAGPNASQLLKETFSGSHQLTSGALNVELTVIPSGSSTLTGPISLSFGGPFQSFGTGRVGNSDFTLSVSALHQSLLSLGLESLDGKGYVSLAGTSYRLPARLYRQLESHLSQTGSGPAAASGILGKLGISPLRWLIEPTVSGSARFGGANTTEIRAKLNLSALIDDLGTVLAKASALGIPGASKIPASISPATKAKILAEVRRPSVEIWTGASDRTLRKLALSLTLPVTGRTSTALGGLKSAVLSLDVVYRDLGQPQSIPAPTALRPYRQFQSEIKALGAAIRGAVSSALPLASATGSGSPSGASGGGAQSAYSQCIDAAHGDYTKMYKCAALVGGGH